MDITVFDLIAELYRAVIRFDAIKSYPPIDKDTSDALETEAKDLIYNYLPENKTYFDGEMRLDSEQFHDIINYCEQKNNFLLYRSILCLLDSMIDMESLIKKYDFNKYDDGISPKTFKSLNMNLKEIGIIVLPKVKSLPNTFFVSKDFGYEDKEYKNANYWYDNINDHFNNIICVENDRLDGYTINNVIIDLFKDRNKGKIVIGATPCCNAPHEEIMKVNTYFNPKTKTQHFAIEEYYNSKDLTSKFLNCLRLAKENQVDILIGPEMLGTLDLCEADDFGYNQHFRNKDGYSPHLIATPSVWYNGKNYISVYSKTGELIGKQYKQNCFVCKYNGKRYEEALIDTPKEILLIHVPGWGRITFPICVDLLVVDYRDLLVRELKSNLIFCPSYSDGEVQFGNASGTIRDFDTRLVWLNTCSALRKSRTNQMRVGFVSTPIISPEHLSGSATTIDQKCNGKCLESCLFTITIYAKSENGRHCNDVEIKHVPFE